MQTYFSRATASFTAAALFLVATTIFAQQMNARDPEEATTTQLVAKMTENFHLNQHTIDDNISSKLVDKFIKDLDPQKLYFYESDIANFNQYRKSLDDMLRKGNVDFANLVFDTFLKRVDERATIIDQLIDTDHDFTLDEEIMSDADDMTWAKNKAELDERWRKRIKYNILTLKLDEKSTQKNLKERGTAQAEELLDDMSGITIEEIRDRLHKRYRSVSRTMHQMERVEVLELYLSAMTQCFDPHSSYMSPRTLEDFQINMRLSLDGIGAALRSEDGYTTVAEIMAGGAAYKDGRLQVDDKIVAVGQDNGEMVDIVEMKLTKVVQQIRGPRGTKVRLQVKKAGTGEVTMYELTRQKIELTQQEVKGRVIEAQNVIGRPAKIGVVDIPSFYRDFSGAQAGTADFKSTAVDVSKVLEDFRKQNVELVVVDLRNNGGGALTEAIDVSGLFIDRGPVVQVKEQSGRVKSHDDEAPGVAWNGPMVVICNRLSASASEIFAGVIKDYHRGIIVGDMTTHGKGTVQNVMPVNNQMFSMFQAKDRGALKLTIQQFYRVNGESTQNRGVRSDVVLPSLTDHMDLGESFLENALDFSRVPEAVYQKLAFVTEPIISQLAKLSQDRISKDPKFEEVNQAIARYLEVKNRKTVSLNEEQTRKERDANSKKIADTEESLQEAELGKEKGEIFQPNFYNDEILQISVDYLDALKATSKTAQRVSSSK
ncbi:carboxy terminal-processing peptidase [Lacunimicrobium album]